MERFGFSHTEKQFSMQQPTCLVLQMMAKVQAT